MKKSILRSYISVIAIIIVLWIFAGLPFLYNLIRFVYPAKTDINPILSVKEAMSVSILYALIYALILALYIISLKLGIRMLKSEKVKLSDMLSIFSAIMVTAGVVVFFAII